MPKHSSPPGTFRGALASGIWAGLRSIRPGSTTPYGAVREGDYRLIEFYDNGRLEIYNLKEDIGESVNLAERLPAKCAALRKKLADWRKSIGAQMPPLDPASRQQSLPTTRPTGQ